MGGVIIYTSPWDYITLRHPAIGQFYPKLIVILFIINSPPLYSQGDPMIGRRKMIDETQSQSQKSSLPGFEPGPPSIPFLALYEIY